MATRAVEHLFTGATTPYTSYDSTKTVLGDLIKQYTGAGAEDKYAGPIRTGRDSGLTTTYALARPNETSTAVPGVFPHVVRWAAKSGYYSTGTVAVSATAVTGTSTDFLASGTPVGARIGCIAFERVEGDAPAYEGRYNIQEWTPEAMLPRTGNW
jgi:hypothetical protein